MAFSWATFIIQADKNLLRQAMTKAKKGTAQTKLIHPDEVRDANQGDYTKLKLRLKKEHQEKREAYLARNEIVGEGKR